MKSFHDLPRVSDAWTFLYVEHAKVDREDHAIVIMDERGKTSVPVTMLSTLVLGPGTNITHAAMVALAESGCSAVFSGEGMMRFYASGIGETRSGANLMAQARAWADPDEHRHVVERMYRMRFRESLSPHLTLDQIRGMEGVRVRETYQTLSRTTGVPWRGRNYQRGSWQASDPINRAISAANAVLNGVCHGVLTALGFSVGLGFVHTGKALAFVYDVADLYKCDVTLPAAFRVVAESSGDVESRVRRACRQSFREARLLRRIARDVQGILGLKPQDAELIDASDDALPIELWDTEGVVAGGRNFGVSELDEDEND